LGGKVIDLSLSHVKLLAKFDNSVGKLFVLRLESLHLGEEVSFITFKLLD